MPTALYRFRPYFYPRPPRGGRQLRFVVHCQGSLFLSTPSARRATHPCRGAIPAGSISIHALREEGDRATARRYPFSGDFYPRPPRGGRRSSPPPGHRWSRYFYPRPPRGGRRLRSLSNLLSHLQNFYPRPPRGGRHFLTEDEDVINGFLSTPSARRATLQRGFDNQSVIFLSTPSARRATARRSTSP